MRKERKEWKKQSCDRNWLFKDRNLLFKLSFWRVKGSDGRTALEDFISVNSYLSFDKNSQMWTRTKTPMSLYMYEEMNHLCWDHLWRRSECPAGRFLPSWRQRSDTLQTPRPLLQSGPRLSMESINIRMNKPTLSTPWNTHTHTFIHAHM